MPNKTCLTCGGDFSVIPSRADTAKFCSQKCYHNGQKQDKTSHPERYVDYIKLECTGCGKSIEKLPSRANKSDRHFCSQQCYLRWNKSYQQDSSGRRARYREAEHASCEICEFERYIEVAHIAPASEGGTYDKDNILFLCPNHHRLFDSSNLTNDEKQKLDLSGE